MRYTADISPAIREMKKLHLSLVDHVYGQGGPGRASLTDTRGLDAAKNTVISIVPANRRRELGWYKYRMWERKSDGMLKQLDPSFKAGKYHEIFIAGEALVGKPSELVLLMMHQVAHQAASVSSDQSYHGEWLKHWMSRLFGIKQEAFIREDVLGWVGIDQSKMGDEAHALVSKLAKRIKPENIDLFRDKKTPAMTTGKMYLWHCDCPRAPRIRTGGILMATCDKCMKPIKFRDGLKVGKLFINRIPLKYLPIDLGGE